MMLKIGDFSKLGQVSIRMLRHYDEMGLLKPAHIDQFTEYRFYTIDQLPRLNRILALKDLGLSLEQIRAVLTEELSAAQLHGMLIFKQAEIEQQVQENQRRLRRVQARIQQIEQEGHESPYEIVLKQTAPLAVLTVRRTIPHVKDMKDYRYTMYRTVYAALERAGLERAGPETAFYHNTGYTEDDIEMEAALVVRPSATAVAIAPADYFYTVPATPFLATTLHQGVLRDVVHAISAVFRWIGSNNYMACGPIREIHLFGSELDGNGIIPIILEVQIPIEKSPI